MTFRKQLRFFHTCTRCLSNAYIISAVRTPVGSFKGSLSDLSVSQLSALALKESLERARVPCQNIQTIFLGCSENLGGDAIKKLLFLSGLTTSVTTTQSGIQSVVNASRFVASNRNVVCAAVGVESGSKSFTAGQNSSKDLLNEENLEVYTKRDFDNFKAAYQNGMFDDEIIKIRKKDQNTIVVDDGLLSTELKSLRQRADGSSSLILADTEYISHNRLSPLAKIMSVVTDTIDPTHSFSSIVSVVNKGLSLAGCSTKDITQWELDNCLFHLPLICSKELSISPSQINKNGSSLSMGQPTGMTGARIVSHLAHSLDKDKMGCSAACSIDGSLSVVVIHKLKPKVTGKPHLTLYTKHPCQLCEELKKALYSFKERFTMEEVDIEAEGNRNVKSLYKYEIPVLFLDGKYLCKHRIDIEYFSRRLEEAEKARIE